MVVKQHIEWQTALYIPKSIGTGIFFLFNAGTFVLRGDTQGRGVPPDNLPQTTTHLTVNIISWWKIWRQSLLLLG